MTEQQKAILKIPGVEKEIELPIINGTDGPSAIDVRNLYQESGHFTYDPGFMSTASCESSITYIDGEAGILRHRGYNIVELAEKSDFMEVCYLLLYGELPNQVQKNKFVHSIKHHTMVHEQLQLFFRGFQRNSHPMSIMVGTVSSLSAFYHESLNIRNEEQRDSAIHKLIAKVPDDRLTTGFPRKYNLQTVCIS
jgi:citrate synthase